MNARAEQLLSEAVQLPESDRASLADALYASLDKSSEDPERVSAAWSTEIERRVADLKAGNVQTVPIDEVRASLDSIIRRAQAR